MPRALIAVLLALAATALLPSVAQAATCSDYSTQAQAQAAADTRDGDGDGVYCEDLPCPCSNASGGGSSSPSTPAPAPDPRPAACVSSKGIVPISFSRSRYPHIRRHMLDAIADGWPRTLVINRAGADARRDRALEDVATRDGYDRDEYPPAVGRGRGPRSLRRGINPVGWMTDVQLVPSSENRSHGSRLGTKLRRYCDGTRFRYVFY